MIEVPFTRLRAVVLPVVCWLAASALPAPVAAQSVYGVVRGTVRDSLGPAIGARVSLVGTAFTEVTDLDGTFGFSGVPAGTYVLQAEGGGAPGEVDALRVPAGESVTVTVRLGERRAWPGGVTSAAGEGSGTVLSGPGLRALPIDDPRQALELAPGVVMRGTDLGIAGTPDLTIRGSGADQTAVFVDGAPARFETLGLAQVGLGLDAVADVAVLTGTPAAAVADARGAAMSYVTRAGGPRFAAGLTAGTDGPFSRSSTVGFNRFDGYAGGPVPWVAHLTWFVSGALYGQGSDYRGSGADTVPTFGLAGIDTVVTYTDDAGASYTAAIPRFAQVGGACGGLGGDSGVAARQIRDNYGLACQGLRLAYDWSTSRRAQAKLLYSYGAGSSVSLTGILSDDQHRDAPGADIADNALFTGSRAASALAVLNWSHRLRARVGGGVRLTGNLSVGSDSYQSGPLDLASEGATRDPALGIEMSRLRFAGLDGLALPLTDAVVRQLRSGTFRAPYFGRSDLAAVQAFRFNPYGVSEGWPTTGFGGAVTVTSETRVNGRLGAEWRATPWLALEGGADYSRTDVSFYDATLLSSFEPNAFTATPTRAGVFVSGRLAAAGWLLEAGVRAEQYRSGTAFPTVPGRIFSNPAVLAGDTSYAARMSRVLTPARTQRFVTPTVRMRYAVDSATVAWAGFSRQVEVPPLAMLFANVNTDLAASQRSVPIGRDVSYATSTLIEGGVRHVFPSSLSLEASVWQKTNVMPYAFAGQEVYDPFIGGDPSLPNEELILLTSSSDSRAVGGEARLAWGEGGALGGSVTYSVWRSHYEPARAPSPIPLTYPDLTTQALAASLVARVPEGWERGSALGAAGRGLSAALIGRATSGQAYTPLTNGGTGAIAPGSGILPSPAFPPEHLPWTWNLDLRLAKAVVVGRTRWTVYAEARNLLDARNLVAAFAETGTDRNALFRNNVFLPQVSQLQLDAGALWVGRQVTVNGTPQVLTGVDLSDCSLYPQSFGGARGVPDCLALRQVEARWGNGDRFYDMNEITRALTAWYDQFYGTWRFRAPARTARVGVTIAF